MKLGLKWLAVVLLALLPVWALAQSQEDFELSCSFKTAREVALYTADDTETERKAATYTLLTTLPADTYIRLTGARNEAQGLKECWYYQDGAAVKGWIEEDAVVPATLQIYLDNGSAICITETLLRDEEALAAHLAQCYPGRQYGLTPPPTPTPAPTPTSAPVVPDAWVSAENGRMSEENVGVRLMQLGMTESIVMDTAYEEFTISTDQLIFAEGVDAAHRIAVIYAPRTGTAALREQASTSGKKLEGCLTGRIVPVLEYGKDFTLVRYEGKEGYVMTDALAFYPGDQAPLGKGTLHMKGAMDGKNTVNIRTNTSSSSAKVGSWKTGLTVTVVSKDGSWYAVEHEGWYGFVHEQYLTMEGE